ncbi:MAG TPA: hypothetical protein VK036_04520 [Wenzhouxiangella sp.]|nr:hypothetical protein [Wenzhouxiangella sp.]
MPDSGRPEPFWNRLADIAAYPLRGGALISLVLYSVLNLFRWAPGILGLVVYLAVWFAACRYAFEILLRTANGWPQPPELATHTDSGVVWRFIGLCILFAGIYRGSVLLADPPVAALMLLGLTTLLPGAIISLALGDSLPHALNPLRTIELVRRMGTAAWSTAFALLFIIQFSVFHGGAVLTGLPLLGDLLVSAITLWGLFAAFHLMGYLVFQYHEALGFSPGERGGRPRPLSADDRLAGEAQRLVADGHIEDALSLLGQRMNERAVSLEVHALYRSLLSQGNDRPALIEHARIYLNLLMLEKEHDRALALAHESLEADPGFTPLQAQDGHQLARFAVDRNRPAQARSLWQAMLERWPQDPASKEWAQELADLNDPHSRSAKADSRPARHHSRALVRPADKN